MNLIKLCRNQWDRTLAIALVVGGFVALLVGWLAVSDTIFTFEQIPYVISGGLLGVCLIALGCASWVSADLRDDWRKMDRLEAAVEALRSAELERPAIMLSEHEGSRPALRVSGRL
jgi:hypothetical protein